MYISSTRLFLRCNYCISKKKFRLYLSLLFYLLSYRDRIERLTLCWSPFSPIECKLPTLVFVYVCWARKRENIKMQKQNFPQKSIFNIQFQFCAGKSFRILCKSTESFFLSLEIGFSSSSSSSLSLSLSLIFSISFLDAWASLYRPIYIHTRTHTPIYIYIYIFIYIYA